MYPKNSLRCFVLTLLVLLLTACSPKFNWQEVTNAQAGYRATFPDKPAKMTRTLDLIQLQVPLTMQAVQIDRFYFSVASVPLIANLAGKGKVLREALAQSVANNVHVVHANLQAHTWQAMPVWQMDLRGTDPQGKDVRAQVRYIEHNDMLYQVMLLGPAEGVDNNIAVEWFSGFKLSGL